MDDGQRAIESHLPSAPPSRWTRVFDGERVWGSIDTWPSRYGLRKYRLVVFPPGIGQTDRRYLRLARSWPTWGAALWLAIAVGMSGHSAGWTAVALPTTAVLLTGAIAFALARGTLAHTRTMTAALITGYDNPTASARFARLEALTRTLLTADAMRGRGELTVVEHEAIWWTVYEAFGEDGPNHV